MISSLDAVLTSLLHEVGALEAIDVPLLEAAGCAAAAEVRAVDDVPAHACAATDGYAVRLADVMHATPQAPMVLPVVGDVLPGEPPVVTVQPGFTSRIAAGAAVPIGTEAVVPAEWTDSGLARVAVSTAPPEGGFIVPAASRVRAGEVIVAAGTRLRAAHLGMLASAGFDRVSVWPRPRVVVMSVGSELVEPGGELAPGRWNEASGPLMTSALREAGALAFRVPVVPTDARVLGDSIEDQLVRADLLVVIDAMGSRAKVVVRDVLSRLGKVRFDEVACDPVARFGHGVVGPDATPVVVVPPEPLAAAITAEVLVRPLIRRMLGLEPVLRPTVRAVNRGPLASAIGVRSYFPATLDVEEGVYVGRVINPTQHPLSAMAEANALLIVPEDVEAVEDGATVEMVVLERRHA